jgi:predicted nucleotidyltransferase
VSHIILELEAAELIKPPQFLSHNTFYLCRTGSVSYGCSVDTSDEDLVGFCIPDKHTIFPHLAGEIQGFGVQKQRFNQWQQHGVVYKQKSYDLTIYNIVQYFHLCLMNNPNCIDYLFADRTDVLHSTRVGELVRENRHIFLHKGLWPKFKGYAYSQIGKLGKEHYEGKRVDLIEKFGWDVKHGCHAVRLLLEAEQLLGEKDLDLKRHKEQLLAIRRGEWKLDELKEWCKNKEKQLEELYHKSDLPWGANDIEPKVKELLLLCLETHYGSLKGIEQPDKWENMVLKIKDIVNA